MFSKTAQKLSLDNKKNHSLKSLKLVGKLVLLIQLLGSLVLITPATATAESCFSRPSELEDDRKREIVDMLGLESYHQMFEVWAADTGTWIQLQQFTNDTFGVHNDEGHRGRVVSVCYNESYVTITAAARFLPIQKTIYIQRGPRSGGLYVTVDDETFEARINW